MLAKDIMLTGVATLPPQATVLEAAALMVNTNINAVPVVDEQGLLAGIVSEADIIGHIAVSDKEKAGGQSHTVFDIMTRDVISVTEEANLKAVIELMLANRLKVVPVCRNRAVVGTVNRPDIVRLIASRAGADPGTAAMVQDDALRRTVLAAVKGQRWSLAQRFDVVVKDGTVHLWGVVPNDAVHASYCEAAENVPQARSVISHMHVMPRGVRMTSTL